MTVCALVGAVGFNAFHFNKQNFDYVVAVDAGYTHLQNAGVIPDLVIGDFDSLDKKPHHSNVKQFPTRKDESDIELALQKVATCYDTLVVYGCMGGRYDFTYAVFQLVAHFTQKGNSVFIVGQDTIVTGLCGDSFTTISFTEQAAGILSLFSFTDKITGVDELGLEYELHQATLYCDKPMGVSNAFKGVPSRISVNKGTALLFFPVEAWDCIDSFKMQTKEKNRL